MRSDTGQVVKLEDYRPSDYVIPQTGLVFRLSPETTEVSATLTVERRKGAALDSVLELDGDGLEPVAISINGKAPDDCDIETTPDGLRLLRPPRDRRFTVEITTRLKPAANEALMGLYLSNGVFCTQCEAEGFRRITYFLDRPDILSVYTVRIEAERAGCPVLLSNGNLQAAGELPEGRHFAEWHDPFPKPSYLFALVAGDLGEVRNTFTTMSGRTVKLGIYVEHGKEARAAYAMDALKRSMRWDEEVFGLEYDLDVFNIVAVSDFNMGAMENKGLNIFNDKYVLADGMTATDADFANIEAIIAHEYFHNWTGNRITCRDWFQLCLKEGLTVFRDHEFSADQRSRAVKRIAEVRTLKTHQFPEDQGPLAHPVRPRRYREINNFYTATVYEKGAEVVRMIRTILGPDQFRAGMDLYFERHDGDAATIEDFVRAFETASGTDLSQFSLWYHQAGTPHVTVKQNYDAAEGVLTLDIEQSVPPTPSESRKRLMHIPLAFGLVGANGEDMDCASAEGAAIDNGVIHLRKRRHTIRFTGLGQRPVLSINRGFSAPVTLSAERSAADRLFLARHDSDPYSRWQNINDLFTDAVTVAARGVRGKKAASFAHGLIDLAGDLAHDAGLEEAFRALALTPPSDSDIAREFGTNVDPDAIHEARLGLIGAIARGNRDAFLNLYGELSEGGSYDPGAAGAGRRALRNVLLDYLSAAEASPALASKQYADASNMTDLSAALAVLAHRFPDAPETAGALAAFEDRFGDDALVMDKWFQIQATTPGAQTVARVRRLMEHKGFSIANPNRVRALIGTFASGNQTAFNAVDGSGYQLFAETVLAVEKRNPQVAARLATALRSWRTLEPVRRDLAREALLVVSREQGLSTDLRDIVDRMLA